MKKYLSIDIGASSGRHIVGWYDGDILQTEEVYRFSNGVHLCDGHLVWNIDALSEAVCEGIARSLQKHPDIISLAIDTWGVDYVLMQEDQVISPCYAYRDNRTESVIDRLHAILPQDTLYARTGIQFQPFNSIYQLYADQLAGRLDTATDFLMIPEYLTWQLTGIKTHEYTNATTTGLLHAEQGAYDRTIIEALGLPERLFGQLSPPGTVVGPLRAEIAARVGGNVQVVLCASHDTASAVEGIPMEDDALYLSSGTWSLLGIRSAHPCTTEKARRANYSNEGGVGYIRFLKNIMGMWIINRLKDELCPTATYAEIEQQARASTFGGTVDINDRRFLAPICMKDAFSDCLSLEKPIDIGDYFRCAQRSLAQAYHRAIEELTSITGRSFTRLYVVGGGAKNAYLNELIREACGVDVIALPIEATALGNLIVQTNIKE